MCKRELQFCAEVAHSTADLRRTRNHARASSDARQESGESTAQFILIKEHVPYHQLLVRILREMQALRRLGAHHAREPEGQDSKCGTVVSRFGHGVDRTSQTLVEEQPL